MGTTHWEPEMEGHGAQRQTITTTMHERITDEEIARCELVGDVIQHDSDGMAVNRWTKYKTPDYRFMFRPASFAGSDLFQDEPDLPIIQNSRRV